MGFKVYQGEVKDANLLSVTRTGKVLIDAANSNYPFRLPSKPEPGEKPPNLPSQSADEFFLYINEDLGRDVIVQWDGTAGARPPVANPRTQPVTVGTPSSEDWLVTQNFGNVDTSLIDTAFQATIPKGWQSGASVKFTSSMCGLDSFIVTHRVTQGGKQQSQHAIVTARKRLKCHLFEMKRSANPGETATFDEYREALQMTQTFYSDKFGIDLVFPSAAPFTPEGTTAFLGARSQSQLYQMIPAASSAQRLPRDLWYNIVASIAGNELGWGGSSLVSVDVNKMNTQLHDHENWVTSWHQYDQTRDNAIPENWVKGFHPPLAGAEKDIALELARGTLTPRQYVRKSMFMLLLHETGHALGLVPKNEEAGGSHQMGWRDTAHGGGHCLKQTCAMFWEAEDSHLGFSFHLGEETPFDHSMSFLHLEQCTLYLRACDLKDIRHSNI